MRKVAMSRPAVTGVEISEYQAVSRRGLDRLETGPTASRQPSTSVKRPARAACPRRWWLVELSRAWKKGGVRDARLPRCRRDAKCVRRRTVLLRQLG